MFCCLVLLLRLCLFARDICVIALIGVYSFCFPSCLFVVGFFLFLLFQFFTFGRFCVGKVEFWSFTNTLIGFTFIYKHLDLYEEKNVLWGVLFTFIANWYKIFKQRWNIWKPFKCLIFFSIVLSKKHIRRIEKN